MSWLRRLAGIIVSAAATIVGVYAVLVVMEADRTESANFVWRWAFLFFGWFPVILLHELGHAFAAHAAGWRVLAIHVAPFALRLRPFHFSFAGYLGGQDVAGFVAGVPRSPEANTKWRDTLFTAGGPIVSWTTAFVLLPLAASTAPHAAQSFANYSEPGQISAEFMRAVCIALALYSVAAALASSWPQFQGAQGVNDAGMIAALWREQERPSDLTYAYMCLSYGVPRRDWDKWIGEGVTQHSAEQNATGVAANFITFLACLMERDDTGARASASALSAIDPDTAAARIAQAAVAALIDEDQARADEQLAKVRNLDHAWPPVLRLRQIALAGIVALEDGPSAINRIDDSVKATRTQPDFPGGLWSTLNARVIARARQSMR